MFPLFSVYGYRSSPRHLLFLVYLFIFFIASQHPSSHLCLNSIISLFSALIDDIDIDCICQTLVTQDRSFLVELLRGSCTPSLSSFNSSRVYTDLYFYHIFHFVHIRNFRNIFSTRLWRFLKNFPSLSPLSFSPTSVESGSISY